MKVTVLGCGSSGGVPTAGGDWGICDPLEPKNQRLRPSILVEHYDTHLLVDTGPDMRQQLLRAQPPKIDAVLYTHCHADHTHGFDDLRYLNMRQKQAMNIYGDAHTVAEIQTRFAYAFEPKGEGQFYRPSVLVNIVNGPFQVRNIQVQPFVQDHGYSKSLGFRFGSFAYSTDVKNLDEAAFKILEGVEVWIVDAVREEPHPVHSHVAQTLEWIERVKPGRAYLTHMNHLLDYRNLVNKLPRHVEPAYDGLVISC